jgi:long-subunit acyl-CoA synthetase (AMP-forming)
MLQEFQFTKVTPTENSIITVNRKEARGSKYGTVDQKIEGIEVKIAEDGEILVKA